MSVDSVIRRARTAYEGVMSTTVTVTRRAGHGTGTYNAITKVYDPGTPTTVYSGGCLLRPAGGGGKGEEGNVVEYQYLLKFPADTDLQRGDCVTVTASTYDPSMATAPALTVWVADVTSDEWQTTQDAMCTDQVQEATA